MNPMLKASGTKRLKLKHEELLSSFAFNFNLRLYILNLQSAAGLTALDLVGRCRLTVSNPVLKAPVVSALETRMS